MFISYFLIRNLHFKLKQIRRITSLHPSTTIIPFLSNLGGHNSQKLPFNTVRIQVIMKPDWKKSNQWKHSCILISLNHHKLLSTQSGVLGEFKGGVQNPSKNWIFVHSTFTSLPSMIRKRKARNSLKSGCFSPKIGKKKKNCQNPFIRKKKKSGIDH